MESAAENTYDPSRDQEVLEALKSHLKRIVPAFVPTESAAAVPMLIDACLNSNEASQDAVIKFLIGSDQSALIVDVSDTEVSLSLEVKSQGKSTSIVLIKSKDLPLDATRPMSAQIQVASVMSDAKGEEEVKSSAYLQNMHQFTRHFLAPIARSIRANTHVAEAVNEEDDFTFILQKKVRELDFVLEQCQRGSTIPSISLPIPPSLLEAVKASNAEALRTFLERYNATQVDAFFASIALSMGDSEEHKEEFANGVNKTAKLWPAEIIRQTRLIESPFAGTVEKEMNFWKDLDRKLNETREQMDSAPILLTKLVLKRTNRVSEQLIHEAESVLDRALKVVGVSLTFLRDFPVDELQAANSLPKLARCVANCLSHFSKLKHSNYEYNRAVRLLEVLGTVVFSKLVSILDEKRIMHCPMNELAILKSQWDEVFLSWSSNLTTQRTTMRDVAKRRNENFAGLKFELDALQVRLDELHRFRVDHDRLLSVFSTALVGTDDNFLTDLSEAYQVLIKTSAIFDITPAGCAGWISSKEAYNRRLERLDERITRILDERLSEAKSADEMFRIFSVFNPLFYRPTIRSAVNSFRATLMKSVREDVKKLQDKFKLRYDDSHERITADLRDIPPLSGRIIWARQIENQLSTLLERIQNVLGKDWEDHAEGKQLKDTCDSLRGFLATGKIYEDWIAAHIQADSSKYAKVKDFLLVVETDARGVRGLKVNFDDRQIVIYKEVQYLEWLLPKMNVAQKTIPSSIKGRSKEAFGRYPIALALESAIVSYNNANAKITASTRPLLIKHIEEVRELFNEAIGGGKKKWVRWDSPVATLNEWVNHLVAKIINLQERVDEVAERLQLVEKYLIELSTCDYDRATFEMLLSALQSIVDELPSKGLSNVLPWVEQLDRRLEDVLKERLKAAIVAWSAAFAADQMPEQQTASRNNVSMRDMRSLVSTPAATPHGVTNVPMFQALDSMLGDLGASIVEESVVPNISLSPSYHEITVSNQLLSVAPSLEQSQRYWIGEYHEFISVICSLPRIAAGRYQVFAEASTMKVDYTDILSQLDRQLLLCPYHTVEKKIFAAKAFVSEWLQYQALWDASMGSISEQLGSALENWRIFLQDIKSARSSIDVEGDEKAFGPIVINHLQAQNKINLKYDTWQRDAQTRFSGLLLDSLKAFHSELIATKSRLEAISFEGSTKDAIIGVHLITQVRDTMEVMEGRISDLKASEKLLQSQRFNFPTDWLPVSNLAGVFSDLHDILDRRTTIMNTQLPVLQQKIREEDASIQNRMDKFLETWNVSKPIEGTVAVGAALESLSMFSGQLVKIADDARRLRAAKESLRLDFIPDDRLSFVEQEIADLKEAWNAVAPITDKLALLATTNMKEVNPPKVRKALEDLVNEVKAVPSKLRSYASVETLLEKLQKYLTMQALLRDLSTEALKDRHWKGLLDKIGLSTTWKALTLGALWDSNAMLHRKFISDVLSTAQGELALEQFLHDLRDHWVSREIILAARDGGKIVTQWEGLFTTLEDNLNSLASLKQSPYFRNVPEFQEDAVSWETRLTHLRGIFEMWVEVQRKWLYLRGIFKNNDIKAQLPAQFTKFKSIDNEYSSLMKRMAAKPIALEVLQVENLQRQLEREDATMALIQKALGEYLEAQRQIFPRFYFVNNDDLVEIIGNSNEPGKIMVHLGKMFAAVAGLQTNLGDNTEVSNLLATGMLSKEGECVSLIKPVSLATGVKEWLGDLHGQMSSTLAHLIDLGLADLLALSGDLLPWINKYPAQICILVIQIAFTRAAEDGLSQAGAMATVLAQLDERLHSLSVSVLQAMEGQLRQKTEQLLTEMVHQRDVSRSLIAKGVASGSDFGWLYHLRFYWAPKDANRVLIRMSNAQFAYGFEYLGIGERLVQTPLTDRCYLTLTQALHFRMGGNPFGPAGTGKTESVKMLGSQLGRFVLVFNCDSAFDYAAMGRIFSGLCQVGAWGCFDEFNRLEERILSAVSQQILTIQRGLLSNLNQIDLLGAACKLSKDVGIFVTLNPGYAGRSNLPDNLKQLFRAVAMSVPDRKLIAQVMLFSQGIASAEYLAGKIVLLFMLCEEQLSAQSHYDFGLRALKSVLVGAGELKRLALSDGKQSSVLEEMEKEVLLKSTCDSILPKLVAEDIPLFVSLLGAVFPGAALPSIGNDLLIATVRQLADEDALVVGDEWLSKVIQLKQIQDIRHGIMMVGPSGSGKTTAWRILLKALGRLDGVKGDAYVIDPKSIKKDKLFGHLDPNTLEWTDGVFTKILRRLADPTALRGVRRSWIIFDGDVDPEWAENLNSVLDDNKILTLPSGDRLKIPPNVRIMMEVDSLKHATLATVSRCGMVWFADSTITLSMLFSNKLALLAKQELRSNDGSLFNGEMLVVQNAMRSTFLDTITPYFASSPSLVEIALTSSLSLSHVMEVTPGRLVETLTGLLTRGISLVLEYNEASTFPMSDENIATFAGKWLLFSLLWGFGSSLSATNRTELANVIKDHCTLDVPSLLEVYPGIDGEWMQWVNMVPRMEIESHKVISTDIVITTSDTLRHVEVLKAWLASRRCVILCGPPGSGKTMTLTSVLEGLPDYILAPLSFSSGTSPDIILKTFAQYCEVVDSPDGLVLQPNRSSYRDSQWLVIFADEINLPAADPYGTQRVISFIRQLSEANGYWNADCKWVHLRRIQFVGACNPPTDAGRTDMSLRFLRRSPVLFVDYPSELALKQIYRTFNSALLRLHPNLKGYADPLNDAMVGLYMMNKEKFSPDIAPQYIYSPRELSRWVRAMYEAIEPLDSLSAEELVRLWGHEGLRLFSDRLIEPEDRHWCGEAVDLMAAKSFPGVDTSVALQRPILYSAWLKKTYESTGTDTLRTFLAARLRVFYEEELDVPLVIFDEVLEHVLRIDNVLRHPVGHMLLVGESGVGKTVLTRFVAWMNGLTVFQIKANSKYTIDSFDEDLRALLRRVGLENEKICFIFDESNALSSAFLERMNALLASGEIPGLFEGDEYSQLVSAARDRYGVMDNDDELLRRFKSIVQANLHVVFTMNPLNKDFNNRCTTSPALFNRCVVDWFGTWSTEALVQVAGDFTAQIDTGYTPYEVPSHPSPTLMLAVDTLKVDTVTLSEAVVGVLVDIHNTTKSIAKSSTRGTMSGTTYLSPRDYLEFINKFMKILSEQKNTLTDQQTHLQTGLLKLAETSEMISVLNSDMRNKAEVLKVKDSEANTKLLQMIEKQNEAEQRKVVAEGLTTQLAAQTQQIAIRREVVEKELSEAEPSLMSAKQSVSNIRKAQLDEVRALAHPPNNVRLTMEMVVIMIGEASTDWGEIRKVIRRDDFISTVVNFDPLSLSAKVIKTISDTYLNQADLNAEAVERASKACGPLYKWASSQIKYATILRKIKPLRDEMANLEVTAAELSARQVATVVELGALEGAIANYKAEYAAAIRETESIRNEMVTVAARVERANKLYASLEEERIRWSDQAQHFEAAMGSLIGDCLLAAAFCTYIGHFGYKTRSALLREWADVIDSAGILHMRTDMVTYLSKPAQTLQWAADGLPNDSLAQQNAILLERYHRFPLVIDPSGQALAYLKKKHPKAQETSFLDNAFVKVLTSCIRFGSTLLIHDVEYLDPILHPLLNGERCRSNGRTVVRLGAEDVDYSPSFKMILITRNPSVHFSPDLVSRVTMINFTITPSSLQAQVLSELLRTEAPDVSARHAAVLAAMQSQSARLRELQEVLLDAISSAQGAVLDDNSLIDTLERLKTEGSAIAQQVATTSQVAKEVEEVSSTYMPLADVIASAYFTLEGLGEVCTLYQYHLQYFLGIVHTVLRTSSGNKSNTANRLSALKSIFLEELCRRVLPGLRYEDKLVFLVRLAQIATPEDVLDEVEADYLTKGSAPYTPSGVLMERFRAPLGTTEAVARALLGLSLLPSFKGLEESLTKQPEQWKAFLASPTPEEVLPMQWPGASEGKAALLRALVIKALRSERLLFALEGYISVVFKGLGFNWRDHTLVSLPSVFKDASNTTPMMLCSGSGQDASGQVDALAISSGVALATVSMGSAEGYVEADRLISLASKAGTWVLLRNIHLCTDWLSLLEKKLLQMSKHAAFRLFFTSEITDALPTALLRMCEVIVYESSVGLKASMEKFLSSLRPERIDRMPMERARLYGLFGWCNAIIQERLRYAPLGWTKRYEFNDADVSCSLDVIDQWVDEVAQGRAHVDPQQLPWQALQVLLAESLYGGRVDQPFDQLALTAFITSILSPSNYSAEAVLVRDATGPLVCLPDSLSRAALEAWVKALPDSNPPSWIGLPATAENHLRRTVGVRALANLALLEGSLAADTSSPTVGLLEMLERWLAGLPQATALCAPQGVQGVLMRTLQREIAAGAKVLAVVLADLTAARSYCKGQAKMTNAVRDLLASYQTATLPKHWTALYASTAQSMSAWMDDLSGRCNQLLSYAPLLAAGSPRDCAFVLGRMFAPEAFIMACRQETAQGLQCSLEDLDLHILVDAASTPYEVLLEGLSLQGAAYGAQGLCFSEELRQPLDRCKLRWSLRDQHQQQQVAFPLYLNESRKQLVCQAVMPADKAVSAGQWAQRGVAVILQALHA